MKPLAIGTVVDYTGSLSDGSGRQYIVRGHSTPREAAKAYPQIPEELLGEAYPDGVAYEIWPADMLYKFGNRCHSVYRVRRDSLTPVEGKDDGR
jgi:hypothetical protein